MKKHTVTLNMSLFDIVVGASMLGACADIVRLHATTKAEKDVLLSLMDLIESLKKQGKFIGESDTEASKELDKVTAQMLKSLMVSIPGK